MKRKLSIYIKATIYIYIYIYQQWINKIKEDTSGVSQLICSNHKWTSYIIHKRNSPLWLEQNNHKVRKTYPKIEPTSYLKTTFNFTETPRTEATYIHLATRQVTHVGNNSPCSLLWWALSAMRSTISAKSPAANATRHVCSDLRKPRSRRGSTREIPSSTGELFPSSHCSCWGLTDIFIEPTHMDLLT